MREDLARFGCQRVGGRGLTLAGSRRGAKLLQWEPLGPAALTHVGTGAAVPWCRTHLWVKAQANRPSLRVMSRPNSSLPPFPHPVPPLPQRHSAPCRVLPQARTSRPAAAARAG